jgi:hypothetical protein
MNAVAVESWCIEHKLLPCKCPGRAKANAKHKYGAIAKTIDGIRFDSTKEANRYTLLKRMNEDGIISALEIHPRFLLDAAGPNGGKNIGTYEADFSYISCDEVIVEDVKGLTTPLAKWKIKHFDLQYGMKVRII